MRRANLALVSQPVATIVAGADGLLSKAALADELPIAIRRLCRGRKHFPAPPQPITAALRSRLEPDDQPIFSMLMRGVAPTEISSRLRITRSKLEARREAIVRAIAPGAAVIALPGAGHARLDYQRARRRPRYRAAE